MADENKIISLEGLVAFKEGIEGEIDKKIGEAGLGVTYSLSKNDKEEIVLTGSNGDKFEVETGTYSKPDGGIPKSDLASAVQTSLGKADTALQEHQDISGKANVSQLSDGSVTKVGIANVGNENRPVYLKAGVPTVGNTFIPTTGGTYSGNVVIDRNNGTTSSVGVSQLILGNNKKAKSEGASRGRLTLYGTGGSGASEFAATLQAGALTANRNFTFPDQAGTISIKQQPWTKVDKTTNFKGTWRYTKDEGECYDMSFYGSNSVACTSKIDTLYYGTIKIDLPLTCNPFNLIVTPYVNGVACFAQIATITTTQLTLYVVTSKSVTQSIGVSLRCLATDAS